MSLASGISALATAIGVKIKTLAPIMQHRIEMFGIYPTSSSAAQGSFNGSVYVFDSGIFNSDGTAVGGWSIWSLHQGHWSGTYTLALYYAKLVNSGIVKVEWSTNGGSTWTTLSTGIDTYASTAGCAVVTFPGLAIPEGSDVQLRTTVTGKNASSTGYYYGLCGWEIGRTGA